MIVLHLKTQRGQPYGSWRRCCERCGVAILPPQPPAWTDDETIYRTPPDGYVNCGVAEK